MTTFRSNQNGRWPMYRCQTAVFYHYHEQREGLFYVLAGTLSVETAEHEFEVPAESVFVVDPASPMRYNPESLGEAVRVFGVGAPQYDVTHPYDPDRASQLTDKTE